MASLSLMVPPAAGGAQPALTAAGAAGDSFPLPGAITIETSNNGAAARTITLVAQNACNQGFLHNKTYLVPNDSTRHWIDVPASQVERFRDVNGRIQLTYDVNTGLTIGAHQ